MRIVQKIIAGGPGRATRLHTERNEMIPVGELKHLPIVVWQYIKTKINEKRPPVPWWPMSVIPIIDNYLNSRNCNVIEFGSGSSTVWLAQRTSLVVSIEDDPEWAQKTQKELEYLGITNASIRYAEGKDYYNLDWAVGQNFDLAVIDGSWRWKCIESVLPLMAAGSIVYLDNSDADKDKLHYPGKSMSHEAQKLMSKYQEKNSGARLERFSSLISGELHAGEGMLLYIG